MRLSIHQQFKKHKILLYCHILKAATAISNGQLVKKQKSTSSCRAIYRALPPRTLGGERSAV